MPSPPSIYTLSLHDVLPISPPPRPSPSPPKLPSSIPPPPPPAPSSPPNRFRSEEHTSELQSRRDLVCRLPPLSTLFPYTTFFRSRHHRDRHRHRRSSPHRYHLRHLRHRHRHRTDSDRKSTRLNSSHVEISYAVSPLYLHSFPTRRSSDLATTETVTVTAEAPLIDTTSATSGTVIATEQI